MALAAAGGRVLERVVFWLLSRGAVVCVLGLVIILNQYAILILLRPLGLGPFGNISRQLINRKWRHQQPLLNLSSGLCRLLLIHFLFLVVYLTELALQGLVQ